MTIHTFRTREYTVKCNGVLPSRPCLSQVSHLGTREFFLERLNALGWQQHDGYDYCPDCLCDPNEKIAIRRKRFRAFEQAEESP